ncbi:MAG: zinc ribbon domain-containing protein [Bacteroidales bacterium]|nr:zinc ribbon domain-containing protein [Candidatus Sodaliphilus aphodohippi]
MKCNNCGNVVPDGSTFCNICGARLSNEMRCPACGSVIPSNSVFCPDCGKSLRHDTPDSETFNTRQQRVAQPAESSWDEPQQQTNTGKSTYNRNLIIGIAVVAAVIVLLLIARACNSSDRNENAVATDSTSLVANDSQDAMVIFNAELSKNRLNTDNSQAAFAIKFPAVGDNPEYILGLTYVSDPTVRSFFKIYKLTQNGSDWVPEKVMERSVNGRSLSFDNNTLLADITQVPRAVRIEDKAYLYFAFMNMPMGGSNGRVSLCLFEPESKQLTTLDYDGPMKRMDDGRQYIYGQPIQSIASIESRFLKQEAQSIKILYIPTEEELRAEEERLAREDSLRAEQQMKTPDNADAYWGANNSENLNSVKNGQEVSVKTESYDKPIFKMENMKKKIESAEYIVFADKSGAVYGFDKNTRKYFVIYKSSGSGASDIGFGSDNSILRMQTSDGHLQYNLKTHSMKTIN